MKKGFMEGAKWLFVVMVIIGFLAGIYMVFISGGTSVKRGAKISRRKLRVVGLYSKLLSSSTCLGTGETGIFNKTLLEQKNGSTLDCVNLPDFKLYTEVGTASKHGFGGRFSWKFAGSASDKTCQEYCQDRGGACRPRCGVGNDYAQKRTMTGHEDSPVLDKYKKCSKDISTDAETSGFSWCCCGTPLLRKAKERYVFGDNFLEDVGAHGGVTFRVAVEDEEKVVPARLGMFYLYADNKMQRPWGQLLAFTRAAAVAHRTGETNITMKGFELMEETLEIYPKKVCMKATEVRMTRSGPVQGDRNTVCKKFKDDGTHMAYDGRTYTFYPHTGIQKYRFILEEVGGEVEISKEEVEG